MFKLKIRNTQYIIRITYCVFLFIGLCAACAPAATPAYFIPPTAPNARTTAAPGITLATVTPLTINLNATPDLEAQPTLELPSPTPACTNVLTFLEDVTVPDGTVVAAGEAFVKQWRVKNEGTCDWNNRYVLKLVSGDALGAPTETALYPARAGAEIVIEMNLTAPQEAGSYHTVWQAFDPDGAPFEQAIYVDFAVP